MIKISSLNFYTKNEENSIEESINNYKQLFEPYKKTKPTLEDALEQMFLSEGASKTKTNELINIISKNVKEFINQKFNNIKKKYKDISLHDAIIISSYTYELNGENSIYNIYKILNTNIASYNRKQGISNVSKYIFLLLNALRKLDKYYPDKDDKFLYRCITVLVKLDYDSFNPKYIPYLRGKQKIFWGFTSSTPKITTAYDFLGKNKSGTIFTLSGKVWGYDITLFNICGEEEILLEPERKFVIKESLPEFNGIIYVRCSIQDTPVVLENLSKSIENTYNAQKYINIQKAININRKNLEIEIKKHESIQTLEKLKQSNLEDYNQIYELLLKNYYLIFLSEIIPNIKNSCNELGDYIKILKKMINLRFENDNNILKGINIQPAEIFSKKILWLEANSRYIANILNIYQDLLVYKKDLYDEIDKKIECKEIQYEISPRSPKQNEKINAPFFFILESLLNIINSDLDLYDKIEGKKFYDFINLLKIIQENISKIFNELFIFSKEIYRLEYFLNIQQHFYLAKKSSKENLLEVLAILSRHARLENIVFYDEPKLNWEELCENINYLYKFLYKKLGDTENFSKLMVDICTTEAKKFCNWGYRKVLIEIVLKNPKMIPISQQFFSVIINKIVTIEIYSISRNIKNLNNYINIDYIDKINETRNDVLNEIILNILENKFNLFFEEITSEDLDKNLKKEFFKKSYNNFEKMGKENPTFIMFDTSLEIFEECLDTLENIYLNSQKEEDHKEKINNELILTLYCIAYVKIYLYRCINFLYFKRQEFMDFKDIMEVIMGNNENNFRKMIKIYIFKIIFHLKERDYDEFKNYHFRLNGIYFFDEFKENFHIKKKASLNYYLLPIEKYEDYQIIEKKFEDYRNNDFGSGVKEFRNYIEENGIDDFFTISSNIIVSKLTIPYYINDEYEYSNYSSFINNLFDSNFKISKIKKQLFLLFSNETEFNNKIKPKILSKTKGEIDSNLFEILLYSLRICLQTSDLEKANEYFYPNIISKDIEKILTENCVPGNNLLNNIYVNNYMNIENHLKILNHDIGAYVCSCGLYYEVSPCGFPDYKEEQDRCLNCREPIGYGPPKEDYTGSHSMIKRPGHLRIFKDEEHRMQEFSSYGNNEEGIPNMLLDEYKQKVIDPILEKSKFGIHKVQKTYFEQINITIRKLSIIGYRLLNYVLYSHLFFAHCLGFIPDNKIEDYSGRDMTLMNMIETDWNILKDCLQTKGVQNIQVFMNMIFKKLCNLLNNCKNMKTSEEREKFELEVEKMLEEEYKKYDEYQKKYLEINKNSLSLEKNSMKSLMLEINDENEYDHKNFPFYKLLFMTTYPSIDNFKHELIKVPNYEQKYPLLN